MAQSNYATITRDGLWTNNPALVQILGLCPLLAVTNSVVNGIGLGLATMLTLILSNGIVSMIRNYLRPEIRIPVFVLVIASIVTAIELAMNAYFHELFRVLGIFIPLIVTNCVILGRADAFASKNKLLPALYDGFIMGLGFALVLVTIGAIRELLGQGTLFADMELLFGNFAADWQLTILNNYSGFLLAILPPGAFMVAGFLIAAKNLIDKKLKERRDRNKVKAVKGSKRIRTTGTIS